MAANPNTVPMMTTWSKEYQVVHYKNPIYPAISNYRLAPDLEKGDTVKRTYPRQFIAKDMGGDGSFQRQVVVDTEESLVIDKEKETSFYIKELDEIKDHLPLRKQYAQLAAVALHNQIDADVLGEYSSFTNSLDASYFGGTATYGIEATPSNVAAIFTNVGLLMQRANVMVNVPIKFTAVKAADGGQNMPVAVISPDLYTKILLKWDGKETPGSDNVTTNGFVGKFFNYNLFVSNALTWTGTLNLATQPTANDTLTIMGMTVTFVSAIGVTAGNVLIGADVDTTRASLAALINNPSTTNTTQVAFSATPDSQGFSDQDRMVNVVATNNNTTDKMSIVAKGKGYVPVTSVLTAVADSWDTNLQIQHCLIGVEGAIDLVVRVSPKMDERKRDGYVGTDVVTWTCYGKKVFNDSKNKMVDVRILTTNYSGASGN